MLADHIGVTQLRDLASRSEHLSETLSVSEMRRLAGLLYPGPQLEDPTLDLRIEFLGGVQGFPELKGHLKGKLSLLCQRCLGGFTWEVDEDFRLIVIDSEEDFDEVIEPFDAVVAGEHGICLTEIVEDEILGSLPLAPMHGTRDDCKLIAEIEISDQDAIAPEVETNKPFGALADLMKNTAAPKKN